MREISDKDRAISLSMRRALIESRHADAVESLTGRKFMSLYVVGNVVGRPVKIGVASSPISRLAGLQTGNATELVIHHLFWVEGQEAAFTVEGYAHRLCGERHQRMIGEWFQCNDHHAADMIELACVQAGHPILKMIPDVPGIDSPTRLIQPQIDHLVRDNWHADYEEIV